MSWIGEVDDESGQAPAITPGGILDAPADPDPGTALSLFMDDQQLADAGVGQGGAAMDGQAGPRHPIGPIPGYPETGRGAWRAGLDDQFTEAAGKYNSTHGYNPGDPLYVSPQTMKSWAMQESGGSRQAFESDPMQVNKRGDWDPRKAEFGMSEGQAMTPQSSIDGGLNWLHYKATIHGADGAPTGYRPLLEALRRYNGSGTIEPNGFPRYENYANSILGRIGNANGASGR